MNLLPVSARRTLLETPLVVRACPLIKFRKVSGLNFTLVSVHCISDQHLQGRRNHMSDTRASDLASCLDTSQLTGKRIEVCGVETGRMSSRIAPMPLTER